MPPELRRLGRYGIKLMGRRSVEAAIAMRAVGGIRIASVHCGLFGDVFSAFNGLRFAELKGARAEVNWDARSLYFVPGAGNVWSHLFVQTAFDFSGGTSPETFLSYNPSAQNPVPYEDTGMRDSVASFIRNWCVPQPDILDRVDALQSAHFDPDRKPIGVHIRLTDAAAQHEGRRTPRLEDFIAAVSKLLDEQGERDIFIASDAEAAIEAFRTHFGSRVIAQDAIRSTDGASIHGHYDAGVAGDNIQKAKEVLIDALILSRTSVLVQAFSRVTAYALCANPEQPFVNLDRELGLNRGLDWL